MKSVMKRLIVVFIGAAILVLSAGNLYAQSEEKEKKEGFISFGVDIRIPTVVSKTYVPTTMENVPEFVRKVPVHRDDSGAGRIVIIPDSTIQPRVNNNAQGETLDHNREPHTNPAMLGASIAPQITVWRLTARVGVAAYLRVREKSGVWLYYAAVAQDEAADKGIPYVGPLREWSQWAPNSKRGYGTALVYYAAELKPKPPELYGEVEIGPFKYLSAVAGYSRMNYDLNLYSGWDRWNSLDEKYAEYPAIKVEIRREYFGVRLSGRFSEKSKSSVGIEFLVNHLSHSDQPIWQGYPVDLKYAQSPWSFTFSIVWNLYIVGSK